MFCYQFCVTIHDWWHVQVLWRDRSCCDSIVKLVLMHDKFFVVLRMHEHLVNRFKHEPLATTPQCFQNAQHVYGVYYAWIDQWAWRLCNEHTHYRSRTHTLFQINMIWNLHRNSQTKNSVKIFQSMRFHSLIASYLYDFGIQFEFHHMNNKRCVIFFFSFIWFFFPLLLLMWLWQLLALLELICTSIFFFGNRFIYLNCIRFEQIKRKNCQFHMYPV